MKCMHCLALNAPGDTTCGVCHQQLVHIEHTVTPQWAYFFAVACGAIPVIALGGLIPAALGLGGAGTCLKIARSGSVPMGLRLLTCVTVTALCWLLFVMLVLVMFGKKA